MVSESVPRVNIRIFGIFYEYKIVIKKSKKYIRMLTDIRIYIIWRMAVEVRMRTLDRFFEIEFSTYSDITSLRVSLYHVLKRKMLLRQSYRA